jgi:hypothetical protein
MFKNKLNSIRGWEETASTCTSQTAVKAQLGSAMTDESYLDLGFGLTLWVSEMI